MIPAKPTGNRSEPALAFEEQTVSSSAGAEIFVRHIGHGPPVVLLGGAGEHGESWTPLVRALAPSFTVVVPDLRGTAKSSKPAGGYDKRTQALDVRSVMSALGFDRVCLVGHDVGGQVAYAYASLFPDGVERFAILEAVLVGVAPWEAIIDGDRYLHYLLRGTDARHLIDGRDRTVSDRFWRDFGGDEHKLEDATRAFYESKHVESSAERSLVSLVVTLAKDARDNVVFEQTKLTVPVLAVGGEKSAGHLQAAMMRNVATNVQESVVPGAGHWLLEDNAAFTVEVLGRFLRGAA